MIKFHTAGHPNVEMADLPRIDGLAVICEGKFESVDKERFWVYTVAGELDGNRIELMDHVNKQILGATVADDVMIIHAKDRKEADWLAISGLEDTIRYIESLQSAGALDPEANSGIITDAQVKSMAS